MKVSQDDPFVIAVQNAVCDAFAANSILPPVGCKVVLALSGGPDSTALLIAMKSFADRYACCEGLRLHACHVNHGLRGDESEQDEEFCRKLCDELGVPLELRRLSGEERRAASSEESLRNARYKELSDFCASIDSSLCCTGHTLDDQVETMCFRLFRGTGPAGLLGIPKLRKEGERLFLMRPLLSLPRSECLAFLSRVGVEACFDSSNAQNDYSRNYIRNQILPAVEQRFSSYRKHMEQLRKVLQADESLLNCLSTDASSELSESSGDQNCWSLDQFSEFPLALRRRVVYDALKIRNIETDFERIESLLEIFDQEGEKSVCLNDEWRVSVSRGCIIWEGRLDNGCRPEPLDLCVPLRPEGLTLIHKLGLAVRLEKIESDSESVTLPGAQEHELLGDLSEAGQLLIRLREVGDKIQPLGMSCLVRLKKYLHTHKSTKTLSFGGRVLVLANDDEVLWVPGCGMSQRIAVKRRATHRISLLKIAPDIDCSC